NPGTTLTTSKHNPTVRERVKLATHAEVCAALEAEGIEWQRLAWAGWPQLPYEQLKELAATPPTPTEPLLKIKDAGLRKDALRLRREVDESRAQEAQKLATEPLQLTGPTN